MVAALVGSGLLSLAFAWFALYLRGNIFIVGLATNAFAAAVTTYASWLISGREGSLSYPQAPTIGPITVPLVKDVHFLSFLSGHTVIDYTAWALVLVVSFVVFRTRMGLRLRAVGQEPLAARAVGLSVRRIRYLAVLASGLLAGLAGAQLSLTLGASSRTCPPGAGGSDSSPR